MPMKGRDMWDAGQYLRFGGERARPFFDLVAQVGATSPGYVADLGCGPGNLTAALARRWPEATVVGVDSSPEMIATAQAAIENSARGLAAGFAAGSPGGGGGGGAPMRGVPGGSAPGGSTASLSFALGDVWDWRPARPVDVLVCNAVLQWVPGHDELLLRWAGMLAPGGGLASQLPRNCHQPSHEIVKEMAGSARWRAPLAGATLNRQ